MVVGWVVKGRRLDSGEVHASALKFKHRLDFRKIADTGTGTRQTGFRNYERNKTKQYSVVLLLSESICISSNE